MRQMARFAIVLWLLAACSPIPRPGSWRIQGTVPFGLTAVQHSVRLLDGSLLVVGLRQSTPNTPVADPTAAIFDPHDSTWHIVSPPPVLASGDTLTLLMDGSVLLAGGESSSGAPVQQAQNAAYRYSSTEDRWSKTGDMLKPRAYFTATRLADGRVLAVGGEDNAQSVATCEFYDPHSGAWSAAPSLPLRRVYHTAVFLSDGDVLVAGGNVDASAGEGFIGPGRSPGSFPFSTEEVYNAGRRQWIQVVPPQPVEDPTVTTLPNGEVLITGGHFGPMPSPFTYLYDPRTGAWEQKADSKGGGSPVQLADGRLFFPYGPFTYDLSQDLWMPATEPSAQVTYAQILATLDSGQVLVVSGFANQRLTVAFYDPSGFPPLPGSNGPLASSRVAAGLALIALVLLGLVGLRWAVSARTIRL